jgi:glycosyltransferase involved in cell wall biosynthesis
MPFNMFLSVIIPVYNAESFLSKCLDSLIRSKKDNKVEIILINDGSLDNSLEIAEAYSRKYDFIKVFNQKNQGPSAARNAGLEMAKGDYVCFVDSDDYVENDYFDIIFKNTSQDFDVLIFGFNKINGAQIIQNNFINKILERKDILNLICTSFSNMNLFWFPFKKVYKAGLLKQIRFNKKISIGEDTIFNLEAFIKAERVKVIENCLYNYVNNENSLTQVNFKNNLLMNMEEHFNSRIAIHKKYEEINSVLYYEDIAKYYVNHILFWLLNNLYNNTNKSNKLNKLEEIRVSKIYKFSFQYYKFNFKFIKKNILILLFKWRMFKTLNFYYKNA